MRKQDRQCTHNLTKRRVRATVVAMEKQRVLHNLSVCICSLCYPAWIAHAPYCHLWPAPFYIIFPHYVINGTIFENKLLNTKWVFRFSLQLLSETHFILRRNARDVIKCILVVMQSTLVSSLILMALEYSHQSFEKSPNIKFHENPPSGSRVVPCGQTDIRTDMTKLIVAFRNFVNATKMLPLLINLLYNPSHALFTL